MTSALQNAAVPDPVFAATTADFQQSVLMASMQRPMLAYFTASWCGPCKQLRPLIEKVVRTQNGKVGLAVIDIDANPDLASAMRVQSVPQVYAFVSGQPVDGFMGAQPESQLKTFIGKLLAITGQGESDEKPEVNSDPFVQAMNDWSDGNLPAAITSFKELAADGGKLPEGAAHKARAEKTVKFLQDLIPYASPEKALKKTAIHLDKNPVPIMTAESYHTMALTELAQGNFNGAFASLIASIAEDRKWQEERARTDFVTLSEILGLEEPRVIAARKKLSSILFS